MGNQPNNPTEETAEYDRPSNQQGLSSELAEYDFRGRRQNEKVLMVARFHAWLLMPVVYVWVAIAIIVGAILWYFGASHTTSWAIAVGLALGGAYSFYQWFLWNNGTYIITNQRVIRIEQVSLFNRQISEAEIDRIQEISTEINGPIHTLLNFGTVKIQTASQSGKVDLVDVTNPYDIQQEIVRVQRRFMEEAPPAPPVRRALG